jgi:hypothetical protein
MVSGAALPQMCSRSSATEKPQPKEAIFHKKVEMIMRDFKMFFGASM